MHREPISNKLSGEIFHGLILALVCLLLLVSMASAQMPWEEKAPPSVIISVASGQPQDIIVLFDDTAIQEEAAALRRSIGTDFDNPLVLAVKKARYDELKQRVLSNFFYGEQEVLRDYSHLPMVFIRVKTQSGLAQLLERPEVDRVYENGMKYPVLTQSLPLINQPQVASQNKKGAGTAVAVLDTGVDYTRAAFGTCTAPAPGDCLSLPAAPAGCKVACVHDFAPDDGQRDDNGHGTNVSGIVVGVAPDTKVLGLDVFTGSGAWDSDIISAINWCIANKAAYNIVAINMSLGDAVKYTSQCGADVFANPVSNAKNAGILSSIASGNEGYLNGISSPACVPGAVSVGAVYDSNVGSISYSSCSDTVTAADKVTCFSNSANALTMLAPGALITAAGLTMAGTSQASPHIAGAIAVLKGQNAFPSDTPDQTVNRMTSTGIQVTDARNGITKPRIDLLAATGNGGGGTFSISGTVTISGGSPLSGVTIALSGTAGGSTTTDASGNYTFSGLGAGPYTVTPSKTNYAFSPASQAVTITSSNVTGVDFIGTPSAVTFSISGMVTTKTGRLPGVTMTLTGSGNGTATTDSTGNYIFTGLSDGAYTVTPGKAGYTFSPSSRTVNINGSNVANQNFSAVFTGSGTCTFSILPGSQDFAAAGGTGSVSVTTAAGCSWSAASNAAWITITGGASGSGNGAVSYSVASNTGGARTGTLTVAGKTFTVNQSGTGGGGTLSISGTVLTKLSRMSGVTMTLSGAGSGSVTTDTLGNYTFTGLGAGTYKITPSKTGYTFTPTSRTVTISGANITGQNFAGTLSP